MTSSTAATTADRYESLLKESKSIQGVSVWQDGWRRLRRNRLAMASLYLLVLVGPAAALAPALPLQSPMKQDLESRHFRPPNFAPVSFKLAENLKEYRE